jgi:hypothetical protein
MKKIILSLVAIATISLSSFGQSPEGFKYQAVVRDAGNLILNNQAVGMQMTIQQGSIGGTTVYQETFAPTTNTYGLVNLEIGSGTVVSGDFTTIDWANGPYFIETAVDVTGGTNYVVMGTSQLMSVPYALHANTAENVTNDAVNDADSDSTNEMNTGVVLNGTDLEVTDGKGTIVADLSPLQDGTGTDDQNISGSSLSGTDLIIGIEGGTSETVALSSLQDVYTGGDGIDVVGTVISEMKYEVGDFAQGGIVFWVDESGEHGLVCAKSDQSNGVRWNAGTDGITQAKGDGPYSGESNTAIIIAAQVAIGDDGATYAARICNEIQITEGGKTYGDWYLPSKEELNQMYMNKATIDITALANGGDGFAVNYYWSSTEYAVSDAWYQYFSNGSQNGTNKSTNFYLRSVRAF